jgi:hypothetical protein
MELEGDRAYACATRHHLVGQTAELLDGTSERRIGRSPLGGVKYFRNREYHYRSVGTSPSRAMALFETGRTPCDNCSAESEAALPDVIFLVKREVANSWHANSA